MNEDQSTTDRGGVGVLDGGAFYLPGHMQIMY